MKKLVFILLVFCALGVKAYAAPQISARYACLMEQSTGKIIYEYNSGENSPMASTTKIMTAVIALENCKPDEIVTVSSNAAMQEGSSAYLAVGDQIPMRDLLYGLMLNSGNDAAVAVAEHVSGSTPAFCELMNEKAVSLGLKNTHFENPSGLDGEEHYTTASNLAAITAYALDNPDFREIVSTKVWKTDYSSGTIYFSNHNKMLNTYKGCIGVKTGYTKKTGRCLVSAAERGGITLICVTLSDPNDWSDHKAMLDYGFERVELKTVFEEGEELKELKAQGSDIPVVTKAGFSVPVVGSDLKKVEVVLHTVPEINGDVAKGEKLGYCTVSFDGKFLCDVDLVSGTDYHYEHPPVEEGILSKIKSFLSGVFQ